MEDLKFLFFSCASSDFTFGIAPFLWLGLLFVARIKRPQIIKSVLFFLMYGHCILWIISTLAKDSQAVICILGPIYFLGLLGAPVLWLVLLLWSIGELTWIIRRKVKSEKAQKMKKDFTIRAFLQLIILAAIPFGWLNFILRLAC